MTIDFTPQNIITFAALLTAVGTISAFGTKVVHRFERMDKLEDRVKELEESAEKRKSMIEANTEAVHRLEKKSERRDEEIKTIKEEQAIQVYGTLACLKGLKQLGANGEVTDAIDRMEKHLNVQAHK